jgi:excisionase family DNA binding protein
VRFGKWSDWLAAQERVTLTIDETAKRLGIGRNQAYEAARQHQIPTIRVGKRLLVPIAALERLLNGPSPLTDPPPPIRAVGRG